MAQGKFTSKPIHLDLGPNGLNFKRADILIHGVDQSGESFEGRVFLNNPGANIDTPTEPEHGYAGSFSVYGYGLWPGSPDNSTPQPNEVRAPIEKDVIATEAIRAAAKQGSDVVVTIVPVFLHNPVSEADKALRMDNVTIEIHP